MNWIEIITLRSNGNTHESLIQELLKPVDGGSESDGLIAVRVYRNAWIDTDVSIHLHWRSTEAKQQGSTLGLALGKVLEEFGLVNHSAWAEERKYQGNRKTADRRRSIRMAVPGVLRHSRGSETPNRKVRGNMD